MNDHSIPLSNNCGAASLFSSLISFFKMEYAATKFVPLSENIFVTPGLLAVNLTMAFIIELASILYTISAWTDLDSKQVKTAT